MTATTLVQAVCEIVGKEKAGQYGPYRPVLFRLPNGEKRWKSYKPNAPELTWLRKGQTYQAVLAGDEFTLITPEATDASPATSPTPATLEMSPETKQAIAHYVSEMGDLYAYCLTTAQQKIGDGADSETIRCMASSLFISASRHFDLQ